MSALEALVLEQPLALWHLEHFEPQPFQAAHDPPLETERMLDLRHHGPTGSILEGQRVLALLGLVEQWPGRAIAWSYLSRHAGPRMLAITRLVRRALGRAPHRRVEAYVLRDFPSGIRWAALLGFECEAPELRAFVPLGHAASLWARVEEDRHGP